MDSDALYQLARDQLKLASMPQIAETMLILATRVAEQEDLWNLDEADDVLNGLTNPHWYADEERDEVRFFGLSLLTGLLDKVGVGASVEKPVRH